MFFIVALLLVSALSTGIGQPPISVVCSLFVVRELGNFSSFASLVGKGIRRQVTECWVGSIFVVLASPFFNPVARIGHRQEPRCIEALGAHACVQSLNEGVIRGFSWP